LGYFRLSIVKQIILGGQLHTNVPFMIHSKSSYQLWYLVKPHLAYHEIYKTTGGIRRKHLVIFLGYFGLLIVKQIILGYQLQKNAPFVILYEITRGKT
jgi:Gpi18-like mannosyltransferase